MKRLLTWFLLIISVVIPLQAEKWALLVGINNYPNDINPLRYCVADVKAFRHALVNVAGFKEDKIFLMTDDMKGQMEPTHINVIRLLDILVSRIKADDTFVFYFSGHSIAREAQSFLLAANSVLTTANPLELTAIPLQKVREILSRVKAQQLLTIIDAWRNNPEMDRGDPDSLLTDAFAKDCQIRRSNINGDQPSISATLYSCNVGERAYEWDEKSHGIFSYYLLEGLGGQAANSEGQVTITGLAEYTQSQVVKWAQTYHDKQQTPWLSVQGGAKLILVEGVDKGEVTSPLRTTGSIGAEAEMWELVKDSTDMAGIEDFLSIFPSGKFAVVARLKLTQLQRRVTAESPVEEAKKLNIKMVQIPANQFEMGAAQKKRGVESWLDDALPVHTVELDSFSISAYEITMGQYKQFLAATGHRPLPDWVSLFSPTDNHPVVGVSWYDAEAFCKWVGMRLPTEAEWEYAARGKLKGKKYPWGDQEPDGSQCNFADKRSDRTLRELDAKLTHADMSVDDGYAKIAPVGSYPSNDFGLYDMAGNVYEWVADRYDENYYSSSPAKNPPGSGTGARRVLRGGNWHYTSSYLRVASRFYNSPRNRFNFYGFRSVSELD